MPQCLLVQWEKKTLEDERRSGNHGLEPFAVPSSKRRLLDLEEDDELFVAAVVDGKLVPVCNLVVDRVASLDELLAEGQRPPFPLPYQALAKPPLPRMNLINGAPTALSLRVRKEDGSPLARRRDNPRKLDGQGFREPQWISPKSAEDLRTFLERVWKDEAADTDDVVRIAQGRAAHLTVAERKEVELRAMAVAQAWYERKGFEIEDVHEYAPWDLTARKSGQAAVRIEVKGTTGDGGAVVVTNGEREHAAGYHPSALVIVSRIKLRDHDHAGSSTSGRAPSATGGRITTHLDPWDVNQGVWSATVWRYEPNA